MDVEQVSEAIAEVVAERMDALQRAQSQIASAFLQADLRIKALESRPAPQDEAVLVERVRAAVRDSFAADKGMIEEARVIVATQKADEAMGAAIRDAVAPLLKRMGELETALADMPKPVDGKDGKDGRDGKDGTDGQNGDRGERGEKGLDGHNGERGERGEKGLTGDRGEIGQKGADGLGLAGAMIDRDGALQVTLTNGEVKNLGVVAGKDGQNGKDGLSLDSFDMDYLPETHEILLKATAAGRSKELRYPAGGIQPAGYWREGTKAEKGQAWTHDGSLWIAIKATPAKPENKPGGDWVLAARKGRDGETVVKNPPQPAGPISLKP